MIRKFFFFFFVFVAFFFELYFSLTGFVLFLVEGLVFSSVLALFFRLFDRYKRIPFRKFIFQIFLSFSAFLGALVSLFLGFIGWHTFFPGELADITLSSPTHTGKVVFLQMSHIATPEFFATKEKKIQELSNSGYVFLVEGVRGGTPESQKILSSHLGVDFTPTLYSNIAHVIGFEAQDNRELFRFAQTGSLRFVDVSVDDIARILPPLPTGQTVSAEAPLDMEKQIKDYLTTADTRDLSFLRIVATGLLNASLKSSEDIATLLGEGEKSVLMRALLEERNKRITDYIASNPRENIAVVYGALHFNGVFESLQKLSPSWKIEALETYFPYKN